MTTKLIIRDRQERATGAKGSVVSLMSDLKKILAFIDMWHKDPNTPLPNLNLTPGQSHKLTAFIMQEKWQFQKGRQVKIDQYKKSDF